MEEAERRRRAARLTKIIVALVVVVAAIAVVTFVYLTYLRPKPVVGVPMFRYESTVSVTATQSSVPFEFEYETVTPPFRKAVIVLNVTSCTADGTLEIRPLNYRLEVHKTDTFPKVGEVSFTEQQLNDANILNVKSEGTSTISPINWGFEGTFQFIIYIESETA